jgi:hypothetical protein
MSLSSVAEIVVAVGTLVLALATWRLARQTAKGLELQNRPALIPIIEARDAGFDAELARLTLRIRNAGNGPALNIEACLLPWNSAPNPWDSGAIAPISDGRLIFDHVSRPGPWPSGTTDLPKNTMRVELRYFDVTGVPYTTHVDIERSIAMEREIRYGEPIPPTG